MVDHWKINTHSLPSSLNLPLPFQAKLSYWDFMVKNKIVEVLYNIELREALVEA
jgi:hypothetical protein